nr:hypothetical protein [Actinomycetota bacterium]
AKANAGDPSSTNYPDKIYREVRTRPLLLVHLLEVLPNENVPKAAKLPKVAGPVVAWGISFPATAVHESRVEFLATTTWLRESYGDDIDEEEMDGDQ